MSQFQNVPISIGIDSEMSKLIILIWDIYFYGFETSWLQNDSVLKIQNALIPKWPNFQFQNHLSFETSF